MITYASHRIPQRGAALIISMIMLLVITVIGVSVMGGSRLEWLMASNTHFQSNAYMNAEAALNAGLATLPSAMPSPPATLWTPPALPVDATDVNNWNTGSVGATTTTATGEYIVEYLGCSEYANPSLLPPTFSGACGTPSTIQIHTYRVWARGTDSKGASRILSAIHTLVDNQSGFQWFDGVNVVAGGGTGGGGATDHYIGNQIEAQ